MVYVLLFGALIGVSCAGTRVGGGGKGRRRGVVRRAEAGVCQGETRGAQAGENEGEGEGEGGRDEGKRGRKVAFLTCKQASGLFCMQRSPGSRGEEVTVCTHAPCPGCDTVLPPNQRGALPRQGASRGGGGFAGLLLSTKGANVVVGRMFTPMLYTR